MASHLQGITSDHVNADTVVFITLVVMATVAFYNVIELIFLLLATFKRYKGLYFWSMMVSSLGCFLHGLGFLMKFFHITKAVNLSVTIVTIGWYSMVTGQAIVLWSRLYLVELNQTLRIRVLYLIIFDAICFHIPTTVLTYGSNAPSSTAAHFIPGYKVMEKIQMTAFCLQEFLLSGIYIRATWQRLPGFHDQGRKRILMHLFAVNVIIIFLDLALLGCEYANLYVIEVMLKSAVYSVKLKLEFSILGQLIDLVRPVIRESQDNAYDHRARRCAVSAAAQPQRGTHVFADKADRSHSVPTITKTTEVELSWLDESEKPKEPCMSPSRYSSSTPFTPTTLQGRMSGTSLEQWSQPHAL